MHCDRILLKVIDAASIEGFYKSLKYNARRYPAVIIGKTPVLSAVSRWKRRRRRLPGGLPCNGIRRRPDRETTETEGGIT